MSEQEWIYQLLSEEFGPVSRQEIEDLVTQGTLSPEDRIRRPDSETWLAISAMPGDSAASPDEISDLSELSFSFEENESSNAAPQEPDLDIDSFNLQGDTDSPQPASQGTARPPAQTQPVPEPEAEPETGYYMESLGQELGPMPLEELISMVDSGTLSRSDKVREEGGEWQLAENFPAVSVALMSRGETDFEKPEKAPQQAPASSAPTVSKATDEDSGSAAKHAAEKRPASQSQSTGRKKKKRRKKKDEALEEIFSEVFTKDGKLREDRGPASTNAPADADQPPATPGGSTAAASSDNSAAPQAAPPISSPAAPAVSTPPPPVPPRPPSPVPPPPAARPPAPAPSTFTPSKKKRGKGFSLSMPDPKVLGIIGGVIAVGLLIAGFATGIISVPGFAPDAKTVVQQFTEEYNKLGGKNISESDWKELQQRTREAVVAVNRSMMGSQMSAEDMKLRFAITKLGAFVSAKFDDEEARSKAFEDVKAALSQL